MLAQLRNQKLWSAVQHVHGKKTAAANTSELWHTVPSDWEHSHSDTKGDPPTHLCDPLEVIW